jgi:hypothetical protein
MAKYRRCSEIFRNVARLVANEVAEWFKQDWPGEEKERTSGAAHFGSIRGGFCSQVSVVKGIAA